MARRKKETPNTAPTGAADPSPDVEAVKDVPVEASYADSDATVLDEVDVLVTKDIACVIPATVYGHEVPILQAAHGSDRVEVVGQRKVTIIGFNPVAELDRLQRKYKARNSDPLAKAYPLGLRDIVAVTGATPSDTGPKSEALVKIPARPAVRKAA